MGACLAKTQAWPLLAGAPAPCHPQKMCAHVGMNVCAYTKSPLILQDPCPPPPKQKVGALPPPDSKGPLLKLTKPALFINGEFDAVCPATDLKALAQEMAEVDLRAVVLPVRRCAVPLVPWCACS